MYNLRAFQAITKLRKRSRMYLSGISMEPLFHAGDSVIVEPAPYYHRGDMIAYIYGSDGILIHRIIEIEDDIVVCKGDNAIRLENVHREDIIGRVITLFRHAQNDEIMIPEHLSGLEQLCDLSKEMSEQIQNGKNIEELRETTFFKDYQEFILLLYAC